jgi:hypothetical protein
VLLWMLKVVGPHLGTMMEKVCDVKFFDRLNEYLDRKEE